MELGCALNCALEEDRRYTLWHCERTRFKVCGIVKEQRSKCVFTFDMPFAENRS